MYYIHIDCNSYFASCEVATNPSLEGRPVIVANDNDNGGGVILALTPEAKAIGLKRGTPLFKVRDLLRDKQVVICNADHRKYRAISRRIMQSVVQQGIILDFVQYSVDEFFGILPLDDPSQVRAYAARVRNHIWDEHHMPTGCGCSQTYTLAKVATHYAKHFSGFEGICVLTPDKRERALAQLPIGEVWGIGRQLRRRLGQMGVATALDFVHISEQAALQVLNTSGMHTWHELQGRPMVRLEAHDRQKSIMQSHTFANMITDYEALATEVRRFASRCATSLRSQQSLCTNLTVFVNTNRFRDDLPQYANSITTKLPPTADTPLLMHTAETLLRSIFRNGFKYKRAGVVLGGIKADQGRQLDLFSADNDERRRQLMQLADSINNRFGVDTITFGDPSNRS